MKLLYKNRKLELFGCLLTCLVAYSVWDYRIQKNFDVVQEKKLYRSGQPSKKQLEQWIRKYSLRTIIVLKPTLRPYEKEIAERYGVKLHHIPLTTDHGPTEEQWQRILALLMDEQNHPLFYHCHGGADKTGVITAMYRVEIQKQSLRMSLLEMYLHYHIPFIHPALQKYLRSRYSQ
jgi:protein tyrosine/serine phosphatase